MTIEVLSVRPDRPNISQRVLETRLDEQSDYNVTRSDEPQRPDIRITGDKQLLWSNQYLVRKRWEDYLKNIIPLFDWVISMGEPSHPAVRVSKKHNIPVIVFIRSLGVTGLMHYDPNYSYLRDFLRSSWGARVQYPFVVDHVRKTREACRGCDVLVSNSEYIKRELQIGFGTDSTVIYPPINLDDYRVDYNPDGKIGMVGPRKKRKGGYLFHGLTQQMPNEEFISCGLLNPRDLERKQESQSNWDHVGWVEDMREFYKLCKLVVVPSERDEAFGRAAAEPMVSGIPVVASDLGGLREVVGDTGLLIPTSASVTVWKGAIEGLLEEPLLLAGDRMERVERFSANTQFDKFMDVVTDVTG